MTIKVGEVGRDLYVGTTFDLSSNTELIIRFTSPDGAVKFNKDTSDGVTAPATPSPSLPASGDFSGGVLPADTYMLYTTDGTEFTTGGAGNWTICANYQDATPKSFDGDDTTLVIGEACD
jgi:hypothetical protein